MPERRSVLFLAGDLSGERYAARLARAFAGRHPEFSVHALGGQELGKLCVQTGGVWLGDTTNCSAIGLTSVIPLYCYGRLLQFRMRHLVRRRGVDAVVLCDWGGYNGRQLHFFRSRGVPSIYYIPPGSWKRSGRRSLRLARLTTRVATPFSWSAERLDAAGGSAEWVGHPLLETRLDVGARSRMRTALGIGDEEKLVAIMPCSRLTELRVLGPRFSHAARIMARRLPSIRFIAPVPSALYRHAAKYIAPPVQIVEGRSGDVLAAADVAIVKTGSATLEAALAGVPQVAAYDVGNLTKIEWVLLWSWKHIPFVSLPNIMPLRRFKWVADEASEG